MIVSGLGGDRTDIGNDAGTAADEVTAQGSGATAQGSDGLDAGERTSGTGDVGVDAILVPLHDLHRMPTPDHGPAYAALHDELLAELNAEVDG